MIMYTFQWPSRLDQIYDEASHSLMNKYHELSDQDKGYSRNNMVKNNLCWRQFISTDDYLLNLYHYHNIINGGRYCKDTTNGIAISIM